jgi:mono/diheme cytochrome c family protein
VFSLQRRLILMVTTIAIALVGAGCGRATQQQIDQALGITPTATLSPEQIAAETAAASSTSAAHELALSSPGAAAVGDVAQGERQFETWCVGCHGPGGVGPDILSPGSPGASVTAENLLPLVREGDGHTPPGPYKTTEISDKQIKDVAAYIQSSAGS